MGMEGMLFRVEADLNLLDERGRQCSHRLWCSMVIAALLKVAQGDEQGGKR